MGILICLVGIQSAVNFGCACFIFPQTVSHKYLRNLISVLELVKSGIGDQTTLLSVSPINLEEWGKYKVIQEKVQKGKAIFIGMIPMEEFLQKEISYCRLRGKEIMEMTIISPRNRHIIFHVINVNHSPAVRLNIFLSYALNNQSGI